MNPRVQKFVKVVIFAILLLANVWVWNGVVEGCRANPLGCTSTPSMPTSELQSKSWFCRRQRPDDKVQIRYKALGGLVFATFLGGDGGSRTRVRREDHSNHYMRILSFELHSTVSDRQATDRTTPSAPLVADFAGHPQGRCPAILSRVGASSEFGRQHSGRRVA